MRTVESITQELFERYPALVPLAPDISFAYQAMADCFKQEGKLLVCGNGGSAADAEHIVGELMKGFLLPRALPDRELQRLAMLENGAYLGKHLQGALPAIALSAHTALSTAFSNDVAPDLVFAQQVYGYGRPGDLLLLLSTSGNSANILHAAAVAKANGLTCVAITGQGGGKLADLCDICIRLPAQETFMIQELTLPVYHALCAMLEIFFFG